MLVDTPGTLLVVETLGERVLPTPQPFKIPPPAFLPIELLFPEPVVLTLATDGAYVVGGEFVFVFALEGAVEGAVEFELMLGYRVDSWSKMNGSISELRFGLVASLVRLGAGDKGVVDIGCCETVCCDENDPLFVPVCCPAMNAACCAAIDAPPPLLGSGDSGGMGMGGGGGFGFGFGFLPPVRSFIPLPLFFLHSRLKPLTTPAVEFVRSRGVGGCSFGLGPAPPSFIESCEKRLPGKLESRAGGATDDAPFCMASPAAPKLGFGDNASGLDG